MVVTEAATAAADEAAIETEADEAMTEAADEAAIETVADAAAETAAAIEPPEKTAVHRLRPLRPKSREPKASPRPRSPTHSLPANAAPTKTSTPASAPDAKFGKSKMAR